jgi:broad specificity phosphatase PhoE
MLVVVDVELMVALREIDLHFLQALRSQILPILSDIKIINNKIIKMVLIYMRHAEDNERDSTLAHDAKITKHGKKACIKTTKRLVELYGYPKRILCSPFLRARQTLKELLTALKEIDKEKYKKLDTRIDRKLGRFFTPSQQRNPEIRESTEKYNPPVYEHVTSFVDRLESQVNSCYRRGYFESKDVTWCISHGLAIKKILISLGLPHPDTIPFLAYYPMTVKDKKAVLI